MEKNYRTNYMWSSFIYFDLFCKEEMMHIDKKLNNQRRFPWKTILKIQYGRVNQIDSSTRTYSDLVSNLRLPFFVSLFACFEVNPLKHHHHHRRHMSVKMTRHSHLDLEDVLPFWLPCSYWNLIESYWFYSIRHRDIHCLLGSLPNTVE